MKPVRISQTNPLYAVAAVVLGATAPARAANLLINPGFEAPNTSATADYSCAGWTLINDCQRAKFQNNTAGGSESVWVKTNQPAGGGIFQDVSSISAGATYSLTSQLFFESAYPTTEAQTQLGLIWLNSSGSQVGTPSFTLIQPQSITSTNVWKPFSVMGVAPTGASKVRVFLGWDGGGTVPGAQDAFFDDADLEGPGIPPQGSSWGVGTSGDWNLQQNWSNGSVPNSVTGDASFLSTISSPQTVFTNTPVTVRSLKFDSNVTYVIAGAGSLTLQTSAGNGSISVAQGSHKVNLPLFFASDSDINVAGGATLTIGNPMTIRANKTVTKSGNVVIQAPLTLEAGAMLRLTSAATSLFSAPSMGAGAKVDVKNTTLTIDYRGLSSPASTIRNELMSGYAHGAWNGPGFDTSSATSLTGLGWIDDPITQSIKIKYTYNGDADVNGVVDVADFTRFFAGFGTASNAGWQNGDFDYNGVVDVADFTLFFAAFGQSGLAPPPAMIPFMALANVPEPTWLASSALVCLLGQVRRKRRG